MLTHHSSETMGSLHAKANSSFVNQLAKRVSEAEECAKCSIEYVGHLLGQQGSANSDTNAAAMRYPRSGTCLSCNATFPVEIQPAVPRTLAKWLRREQWPAREPAVQGSPRGKGNLRKDVSMPALK